MIKLLKIFPSERAMVKAFFILYKSIIVGLLLYLFVLSLFKLPMVAVGIILAGVIFLVTSWWCERLVIQEDLDEAAARELQREEFKIRLKEIAERREAEAKKHRD